MAKRESAVAYYRLSGLGQAKGDGIERQRAAVHTYAKRARVDIVGEFEDVGVSGRTEFGERAGFAALLDRIESNGVRVVLVERSDRLARDLIAGELLLGKLRDLGCRVVDAEGVELTAGDDDPTRRLVRQILGAVAEFDRAVVVAKLRAARDRKRAKGERVEGRKPFGETPGEAAVLARMLELRRSRGGKRLGFRRIASTLNAEAHVSRTGAAWSPTVVKRIIERELPGESRRKAARSRKGASVAAATPVAPSQIKRNTRRPAASSGVQA